MVVKKCQDVLGLEPTGKGIIADMKEICELSGLEFTNVKDTNQILIHQGEGGGSGMPPSLRIGRRPA